MLTSIEHEIDMQRINIYARTQKLLKDYLLTSKNDNAIHYKNCNKNETKGKLV